MQKFIISLICCLLPAFAYAASPEIRDNAPDRHIVVKGDTLWDISAKFFNDPWRWPQIWGLNKDTIRDPHWIYPGDVVLLDRATGTLRIGGGSDAGAPGSSLSPGSSGEAVKLSPRMHSQESKHAAIPSIPIGDIEPFLSRPLVIEKDALSGAPTLVGTFERRVILGNNDIAYVQGLSEAGGTQWQIYRAGKTFLDPDTKEVLGHEAIYLGEANVEKYADVSTIRITKSNQEITKGDRLIQISGEVPSNYVPHAPANQIAARVISIYGGVSQGGQNTVITLNKGQRDGLENGHVLALYRKGEVLKEKGKTIPLPDMRYGLTFVFRTFDKVSYALVMQTRLPVTLLDSAQTP
ncbi:MAG: LysM peptidoglycan-binding domain-containing protein [Nitrosomonadales bacterium]|nr:LysM peptidoglycan-binding domain-containing protein [Nitrosomonadales bacterium]